VSPRLNGLYVEDEEIFDLPMLESFDCGDTALPGTLVKQITFRSVIAGNLKRLSIGGRVVDYGMRSVEDEYPVSESVAELSVASLDISEERIIKIIKLYPNLRKLDVSRTKVTGVAIKDFVNMGITWVKCNDCYYISPDAVEYARGNGVEVEFTFPSRTASFRDSAFAAAF
jgi:F-box/TPR repeat protein Pof3